MITREDLEIVADAAWCMGFEMPLRDEYVKELADRIQKLLRDKRNPWLYKLRTYASAERDKTEPGRHEREVLTNVLAFIILIDDEDKP